MLIPFKTLLAKYNIHPTGVFHVGASTGQECSDYVNAGIKNVVWIEAIPSVFAELEKNIEKYPSMLPFNYCIGDEDGKEVKFNISSNRGESSSFLELGTHKDVHPDVSYISSFTTKTKRIDTLLKENNLSLTNYDFLNIDLQGSELSALKGMGEELHKIRFAYLEINWKELYIGCALLPEVDAYMKSFGFKLVQKVEAGRTSWGDGFWIKK